LVKDEFEKKGRKTKEKNAVFVFFCFGGGVGERNENRFKTFGSKKRSNKEFALLPCDIHSMIMV
jgi:hypothetical protein